ncbi:MAG: hypothetical protein JWO05_2833 [Gemmatimonadetes bacterium]|nr:hypothetical protein [Gemmatimonadota bacterium]
MDASMSGLVSRFLADRGTSLAGDEPSEAERRLAVALDDIGWRAASDVPASEVAAALAMLIAACVDHHHNLATLRRDIADCLQQYSDHLDGSAPPRSAWEPAAESLIQHYSGQ